MGKSSKTNAMRLLDKHKIQYDVFEYNVEDKLIDGHSVCEKIGVSSNEMFKTLVLHSKENRVLVFALPVSCELDLKKAAEVATEKKVEMLPLQQLLSTTGYEKGGCSPIGMKKKFDVFVSDACQNLEYMYINGGKVGMSIRIKVADLLTVVSGNSVDITS